MSKRKGQPGKRPRRGSKERAVEDTEAKPFSLPTVEAKPEIDMDAWDAEGLTVRQRLFVENLLGPAGGNATEAASLAGYNGCNRQVLEVTASRLLGFAKVREAIARRLAQANLTADWLRQTTASLAASNLGTFLKIGPDGEPSIDWQQAEKLGAFVQIRKYRERGIKSGGTVEVIDRSIETHNPAPYLNLMARLLGLVDGNAPAVTVNVTQVSEHDLVSIATRGRNGVAEKAAS